MIFVNFKTYAESSGERGLSLLHAMGEVSGQTSIPLIPVVQTLDLAYFTGNTLLPLWIQYIDAVSFGAHTGAVLPEEALRLGAKGTLLNHSEHPLEITQIVNSVARAREVGLETLVFAKDIEVLKKILELRPNYVSYEPPELVGSTTVSVSEAKPEVISEAAELCKAANIPLIVGAGVHSANDVKVSIERGATGVILATNIVKASDPKEVLFALLKGF